jgi:peptidoglycan/xylan/chitin deacetylase (PgdA/CDA1 family)
VIAGLLGAVAPEAIARGDAVPTRVRPRPGRVALTFDDGPHPTWTPVVLDVLDEYGVKATFFVNGFRVQAYPEVAAEIVRRGHSLQNHTYGHNRLPLLSDGGIRHDIVRGADTIFEATGAVCTCLRPPWGLVNSRVRRVTADAGESIILWTVDSMDYSHQSAARTVETVLEDLGAGDIILMHDSLGWVARDALPVIIATVRARGLEFDTLCDQRSDHLLREDAPHGALAND